MRQSGSFGEAFMPWAGLVVGVVALATVHQFGSDGTFDKCATIAPVPLVMVAALGLLACGISGLVSWRSLRSSEDHPRRVIATISVGCAAFFALAILYPMIASIVLPPCFA